MARIKYFADMGGETFEFARVDYRPIDQKRPMTTSNTECVGWHAGRREWMRVTRKVEYKDFPSGHECDARCMNATGRTMNCECSCGGKNHGKGSFNCVAA